MPLRIQIGGEKTRAPRHKLGANCDLLVIVRNCVPEDHELGGKLRYPAACLPQGLDKTVVADDTGR
ncbi:hypothetical protein [Mesorhizobium sp. ORM16]|uniref:hypothetical protein n=1 Tax=Mesorhizobium sp. ORM16 TaxID=3376989 RepID=UPI0038577C3F